MRTRFGPSGKAFQNLSKTLGNPALADGLIDLYGVMDKMTGVRIQNDIEEVTALLQAQAGTVDEIRAWAMPRATP